jgi:hypothetical protein
MFLCALGRPRSDIINIGYTGSAEGDYNADNVDLDPNTSNEELNEKLHEETGSWLLSYCRI